MRPLFPMASVMVLAVLSCLPHSARADDWIPDGVIVRASTKERLRQLQREGAQNNSGAQGVAVPAAPRRCADDLDPSAPPRDGETAGNPAGAASKIANRDFPSVFQAWEPSSNGGPHDLIWYGPTRVLKGNSRWALLSTAFTPYRSAPPPAPGAVYLASIHYDGARDDDGLPMLPRNSPWWKIGTTKQSDGTYRVPAYMASTGMDGVRRPTNAGTYWRLDLKNPCLIEQLARQCRAAIATGFFDGCMFDSWMDDDDGVGLLKRVREKIGPDALILVNSGNRLPVKSAPYINGIFMEGLGGAFWKRLDTTEPAMWRRAANNLRWAEKNLGRNGARINALEAWGEEGDGKMLRATTALVLTHSDGYALYSRPNGTILDHDHTHVWDPFWDKGLGRPIGAPSPAEGAASVREFQNGTAVFNPPGLQPFSISFPEARYSRATRRKARQFQVPSGDGDIFLK